MGLDLQLLERADRERCHVRWSYSGFNQFRRKLCESAGLGNLNEYKGFGGEKPWPSQDVEPLVPLLNHSDCEGELWGWHCEGLANAIRAAVCLWPEHDYDRVAAERLADMLEAAERGGGVVVFE